MRAYYYSLFSRSILCDSVVQYSVTKLNDDPQYSKCQTGIYIDCCMFVHLLIYFRDTDSRATV